VRVSNKVYYVRRVAIGKVLSIETLLACQGIDFRAPLRPGKGTGRAYSIIREEVPFLVEDVPLYSEISKVEGILREDDFLLNVEEIVGELR
ncbi:MAG: Histidine ammonia-lyase, partial [bacterium 42_11]